MSQQINSKKDSDKIRHRNKDLASRRADLWIKEANHRLNELSRLFMTLVALVFTLSLPLISNSQNLDEISKVFLVISWFFSLSSLCIGVWNVWNDALYFANLAKINNESERIWSQSNKDINALSAEDQINKKDLKLSTPLWPLILQLLFVLFSLIFLVLIGLRILYPQI